MSRIKKFLIVSFILVLGVAIVAPMAIAGKPDWWRASEKTSDEVATAAFAAVPYPMSAVKAGGFLERRQQVEHLKRNSNPNRIGYVYLLNYGKIVGYYVVKGKLSSTQSQLTNTNQTWDCGDGCENTVDSIGDDGSFGINEGGDRGVFFYTPNGTEVTTVTDWIYSDKPLAIDNVPQLAK